MRHAALLILLAGLVSTGAEPQLPPELKEGSLLFVTRPQYQLEHGTEATMYQTGEVNTRCFRGPGALKVLDLATRSTRQLLDAPKGIIRDPEVHFNGKKILFSMRLDIRDDYHLYEINADGTGLKQLTFAPRISDIQPVYLPDDSIIFSSTRDPKYIPCQRHLMANLFRMNADGSNIRQIGFNTQFEGRASLMPDGRVLYTRWEYVDKHFAAAYGLWTVNPDGTDHALYYGGYGWAPGTISDARIIPGTQRFVATFTGPHLLGWGAMVIGDRSVGLDGVKPIQKSWPSKIAPYLSKWDSETRVGGGVYDSFRRVKVKYEDPYPLSAAWLLCARQLGPKKHTGIFAASSKGAEVLLHQEAPGCFDPMPLAPRERPPRVVDKTDLTKTTGTFYVQDVYVGKFMDQVERGSVKFLRVVEAPSKRTYPKKGIGDWAPPGSPDSHHPVALNWNHYNNKRVLGTVPVEADGSAYFEAPAGKFLYFQLLDQDGMMIHSMRSGTMLQPGEEKGCVGCHEDRLSPPPPKAGNPQALARKPSPLAGWYGTPRKFSFAAEVQPVLDKHCIKCHDYGKKAEKIILAGDKGIIFSHAYTNLMRTSPSNWTRLPKDAKKPVLSSVGAGPIKVIPPYSWGSHQSRLVEMLKKGHGKTKLAKEDLDRIVTWIDLNTPYYPSHVTYYGRNTAGRSPLNHAELGKLGKLVLGSPKGKAYGWSKVTEYTCNQIGRIMATHGPPVNFTRPEHSLCLQGWPDKNAPGYSEALALIGKGQAALAANPRHDMPGFKPHKEDQARLDYLAMRREIEQKNRQAILAGERYFEKPSQ